MPTWLPPTLVRAAKIIPLPVPGVSMAKPRPILSPRPDGFPFQVSSSCILTIMLPAASRHMDVGMFQSLGAYSTKVLHKYKPEFLAGFTAQRYDVGVGEAWTGVGGRMQNDMESNICRGLHYDHYRNMRYNHQFSNVRFKHILLPVWIASYTFKKKIYQFMVNGETGRINGKAPVSAAKVLTAVGIILAIFILIVLLAFAMGEPQSLT